MGYRSCTEGGRHVLTFHRTNPKCERKTTAPETVPRSLVPSPVWFPVDHAEAEGAGVIAKSHRRWSSPSWLSVWWAAWTPAAPRSWWTCWCPWSFHKCTCLLWTISAWFRRCRPSLETLGRRDILWGRSKREPWEGTSKWKHLNWIWMGLTSDDFQLAGRQWRFGQSVFLLFGGDSCDASVFEGLGAPDHHSQVFCELWVSLGPLELVPLLFFYPNPSTKMNLQMLKHARSWFTLNHIFVISKQPLVIVVNNV